MGNRQVVEQFLRALSDDDFDVQDSLIHDDYILDYPQSGERVRGRANRRAIVEHFPGKIEGSLRPLVDRIIGSNDAFVTPSFPSWNMIHLAGSGDEFQVTGRLTYPDGKTWHYLAFVTLRGGKLWRETDYFAEPFEPPAWRSQYVERIEP